MSTNLQAQDSKPIVEDTYLISHYGTDGQAGTNRYLTIDESGKVTGHSPTKGPDQEWIVVLGAQPNPASLYTIQNVGTGLYLAPDGAASVKAPVKGQKAPYAWSFIRDEFYYKVQTPDKTVSVGIADCVNPPEGVQVGLVNQNEKAQALRWAFIPGPNVYPIVGGTYVVRCKGTNTVIDNANSSRNVGNSIIGWRAHGGANQKWKLTVKPGSTQYYFVNVDNGMVLGLGSAALTPAVPVTLQNTPTYFQVMPLGSGLYRLCIPSTNYVVDIYGGSAANGAKVILHPSHGGTNQQFYLDRQ